WPPVFLLSVCDVLVVVVRLDVLHSEPRVLISQPASRARDEREAPRLAGEVVFGRDERRRLRAAAQVASHRLELLGDGRCERWRCARRSGERRHGILPPNKVAAARITDTSAHSENATQRATIEARSAGSSTIS